jgi:hypothetical protein
MTLNVRKNRLHRGQRGQALVIGGLMFLVLIGAAGLAVDGAVAYAYDVNIERAASAAALAGVPYLPQSFNSGTPNARSRAIAEAKRNGFDATLPSCVTTGSTVTCPWGAISFSTTNFKHNLDVTLTQIVPTFFMQALGIPPFPITRTAEAGSRPPIRLGSPDNEYGSTVSEIGQGGHFYFLRQKAWHVGTGRGEGDAYGVDPCPPYELTTVAPPNPDACSHDIHVISRAQGNESTDPNFIGGPTPIPAGDRGGENFQITVPEGSTTGGAIEVYNAGFGPDKGNTTQNYCENWQNFLTATPSKCNADKAQNLREDDGQQSKCTGDCSGQQSQYNAVMYTLFQVNDTFVRANDTVLTQTTVFPIDASNYDASPPTYVAVGARAGVTSPPGTVITQTYDSASGRPSNMKTYHSWANIANEPSGQIVVRQGYNPVVTGSGNRVDCTATPCTSVATAGALPPGTYRLRVDLLDAKGQVNNIGSSNHSFAIRVVKPGSNPEDSSPASVCQGTVNSATSNCTVSGWEDGVVSTPLKSPPVDNFIPLFQLPREYAGSTIIVDLFDFGDVKGDNDVSIIDPTLAPDANCPAAAGSPCGNVASAASGLTITNMGINRNGPRLPHKKGTNSQGPDGPAPGVVDDVPHLIANSASWAVARNSNALYEGSWIRVSIPISGNYSPAPGKDYWYVRYHLTDSANDCFSFAVQAQGGPVHLLKS